MWPPERLPRLLSTSDVVVLSAPLTAETSGIVGRDALRQVKRGALLINIGRGQLLDEDPAPGQSDDGCGERKAHQKHEAFGDQGYGSRNRS